MSGCDNEWRSHNSRRKARAGGAGGAMRWRTGEAGQPEARAGPGEPRWLPGAGGLGMTLRLRPERGEWWAFCRCRWQQSRRREEWRACAVYVVGRRACAGCWLSHQGAGTRCASRARSLWACAALRVLRTARFRAGQVRTQILAPVTSSPILIDSEQSINKTSIKH